MKMLKCQHMLIISDKFCFGPLAQKLDRSDASETGINPFHAQRGHLVHKEIVTGTHLLKSMCGQNGGSESNVGGGAELPSKLSEPDILIPF